jgi:hypothetical protein
MPAPFNAAADASPCSRYDQTTACGSFQKIDLSAEEGTPRTTPSTARGNPGAVGEPVGAIRLVGCGSSTASRLQAMGDGSAVVDARGCATGRDGCDQAAQEAGRPHRNFVRVVKQADGTWMLNGVECDPVAGPPRVTPLMVWQRASRLIPATPIGLAPRVSTLVNIQTIMWVDTTAARTLPTVAILGQPVTIHISIDHVAWDFGDDHAESSHGPGKPYDSRGDPCKTYQCPHYYGHTYTSTGRMTVTATATWRAAFRVDGGALTTIPGTVAGPTTAAGILVCEARSVLVPDPAAT